MSAPRLVCNHALLISCVLLLLMSIIQERDHRTAYPLLQMTRPDANPHLLNQAWQMWQVRPLSCEALWVRLEMMVQPANQAKPPQIPRPHRRRIPLLACLRPTSGALRVS